MVYIELENDIIPML